MRFCRQGAILRFICLLATAPLLAAGSAFAAGPKGWHAVGGDTIAAASHTTVDDAPTTADEAYTDGPTLGPADRAQPMPTTHSAREFRTPSAPAMPQLWTGGHEESDDDWAEKILAERSQRGSQVSSPASNRVSRVAHATTVSTMRTMAPSAFSGDRPIQSISSELPTPASEELPPQTEELLPPTTAPEQYFEGDAQGDFDFDNAGIDTGGDGCGDCGTCAGPCGCHHNWFENLTLFAGPQAFKGPVDIGRNGNFGFHEGVNWGAPFWFAERIGYQVGGQVVHSNLSGSNIFERTSGSRTQYFLTAGLFRRAICGSPWQYGVAYDYLSDQYYVNTETAKVRAEISFVGSMGDEVGFWTSVGVKNDAPHFVLNNRENTTDFIATDLYAFFYRRHFAHGGSGRLWGGFANGTNRQGMVGGDLRVPLSPGLSFDAIANYLVPPNSSSQGGAVQESWALTFNLVWYPSGSAFSAVTSPWRPLFNVADNTIFMNGAR